MTSPLVSFDAREIVACSVRLEQAVVLLEIGFSDELAELLVLTARRACQLFHADLCTVFGSQEGGGERDVPNMTAGELELARQKGQVRVSGDRRLRWQRALPDLQPLCLLLQPTLQHAITTSHT